MSILLHEKVPSIHVEEDCLIALKPYGSFDEWISNILNYSRMIKTNLTRPEVSKLTPENKSN